MRNRRNTGDRSPACAHCRRARWRAAGQPPRPELAGHVENEHFCLQLAQAAGLVCVGSQVLRFGEELAVVVRRYDRRYVRGRSIRVHQEDLCQTFGVPPARKHENQGGPGIIAIMELLQGSGEPAIDRARFLQAIVFNYIIGGTDAHAKNYSIMLAPNRFRLAPLYDIASVLPYVDRRRDLRLAMRIGQHYRPEQIMTRHWQALAQKCNFPADDLLGMLRRQLSTLPDLASTTAAAIRQTGVEHEVLTALVDAIASRCATLSRRFGREATAAG